MLAYSASSDEADELRRLTILGRAGPPEHLEWIGQWGIFDALRASGDVVRVAERPELGLRPRLAVGIHLPPTDSRRRPGFAGHDLAAAGIGATGRRRRGHAARRRGAGGAHHVAAGGHAVDAHGAGAGTARAGREDDADVGAIARELGITLDGRAALIGFVGVESSVPADVIALSASAFRADAQIASTGERVYVLLPKTGGTSSVTSWVRGVVAALRRELGLTLRAVIATPLAGLAGAAAARAEVDRVFDSAERHPGAIGQVSSLDEARTTVLLDEIVSQVAGQPRLVDPRVRQLRDAGADAGRHACRRISTGSVTSQRWRSDCMCIRTRCAIASAGSRSCCRRRWTIPTTGWSSLWACGRPSVDRELGCSASGSNVGLTHTDCDRASLDPTLAVN